MTTWYIINYFIFKTFRNYCTMCTGVRIINVKTAFGCNVDDNDNWHTDGKHKQSE